MKDFKELLNEMYPTTRKAEGKSFLSSCYCKIKGACHPVKVGMSVSSGLLGYILGYTGSFETDLANLATNEIPKLPNYILNIQHYLTEAQPDFNYFELVSRHADEVGRRTAAISSTLGYLTAGKIMKSFSNWWNSKFGGGEDHG